MKENKIINVVFWGIFIFYLILMVMILFIRVGMDSSNINLIPLKSIRECINVYDGIRHRLIDDQVWGNVLIFIPAGLYIMIFSEKSAVPKTLLLTFSLSLGIEIIQYIFKVGASDIDDIILNCLGGIIGVLVYLLLEKIFKTKEKIKKSIAIISLCVGVPVLALLLVLFCVNYLK